MSSAGRWPNSSAIAAFFAPDVAARHEAAPLEADLQRLLQHGGETQSELRLRQPDGSWRWVRHRVRLLHRDTDGGGEVVGYIMNVDAERAAEARAMAAARLASLGEMAAGLAHELKQPLQAISLAGEVAQFAARRSGAREIEERLDTIVEQAQRAAEVIEHLRRFARGAQDGAAASPIRLDEVIEATLALAGSTLCEAGIEVACALGSPVRVVLGQRIALEQVLTNLLLNARDAVAQLPEGTPRRISIAAAATTDSRVRLRIADNGGGIPPEVMPRLFEPFVTTKGPDKGTGLGLSICHGLVTGMGGQIDAQNTPEGAVFTITLPAPALAVAEASPHSALVGP